MEEQIVNKIAKSGLITIELESFVDENSIVYFDIKDYLWQGLALREKEFRNALLNMIDDEYVNKSIIVYCSADAIVPLWAYMLIATRFEEVSKDIIYAKKNEAIEKIILTKIQQLDRTNYSNSRVIVKGCGKYELSPEVYLEISKKLKPVVKSLMFGEPCATVPVYKKK